MEKSVFGSCACNKPLSDSGCRAATRSAPGKFVSVLTVTVMIAERLVGVEAVTLPPELATTVPTSDPMDEVLSDEYHFRLISSRALEASDRLDDNSSKRLLQLASITVHVRLGSTSSQGHPLRGVLATWSLTWISVISRLTLMDCVPLKPLIVFAAAFLPADCNALTNWSSSL